MHGEKPTLLERLAENIYNLRQNCPLRLPVALPPSNSECSGSHGSCVTCECQSLLGDEHVAPAIGLLRVTVQSAHIMKRKRLLSGPPDPFMALRLDGLEESLVLGPYRARTYDPNWIVHTHDILVRSLAEPWEFTLYDHHHCIPDGVIGSASFDPTSVQDAFSQADLCIPMTKDGKETAEALVSIAYHPVLEQEKETAAGIVSLTIHEAQELEPTESSCHKIYPQVTVGLCDDLPIYATPPCTNMSNPVWSSTHEFWCADRWSCTIEAQVVDSRAKDINLGYLTIALNDLLEASKGETEETSCWWPLSGSTTGKLNMSAEWKPLSM